ncbi:hypothetical protein ACFQZZ_25565 [Nocardia sp. GCM10030253]|uniref:hypothetical protein n=1 Tax=Nocardia sp. GCM10030253 TaxID=3273404 RepID=UPI0036380FBD
MSDQREEPQSERGAPGSRDTGSDKVSGGPAQRPAGDLGHEETTSAEGVDDDRKVEFTTTPGTDAEAPVPPYEGRKEAANEPGETATGQVGGADVGGATSPTEGQG